MKQTAEKPARKSKPKAAANTLAHRTSFSFRLKKDLRRNWGAVPDVCARAGLLHPVQL